MAPVPTDPKLRLILIENELISSLEMALATDDLIGIVQATQYLKPTYAKLYMRFG
jgi:hypothetical protein